MADSICRLAISISLIMCATASRTERSNQHELFSVEATDCLSLSNFAGQCMVSSSPGACYIEDGLTDSNGEQVRWACWAKGETQTDTQCKAKLGSDDQPVGYKGACVYKEHGKGKTDEEIPVCTELAFHHTQCHPASEKWGACYVKDAELQQDGWMCIQKGNADIPRYRLGDCSTTPTGIQQGQAYSDVCVFPDKQRKKYKCDSVPTSSTCSRSGANGEVTSFGACFTASGSVVWKCFNETQLDDIDFENCETAALPGNFKEHYTGACLFEGVDGYEEALTWVPPTPVPTASPTAAPTEEKTHEPTAGADAKSGSSGNEYKFACALVFVVSMFVLAV